MRAQWYLLASTGQRRFLLEMCFYLRVFFAWHGRSGTSSVESDIKPVLIRRHVGVEEKSIRLLTLVFGVVICFG